MSELSHLTVTLEDTHETFIAKNNAYQAMQDAFNQAAINRREAKAQRLAAIKSLENELKRLKNER